jgi:hypothetical protein
MASACLLRPQWLHPAGEGGERPLLPLPHLLLRLRHRLRDGCWWCDDGDDALEHGDGVGVPAEAVVDRGGDVEAHGQLELGALPVALQHACCPLRERPRRTVTRACLSL